MSERFYHLQSCRPSSLAKLPLAKTVDECLMATSRSCRCLYLSSQPEPPARPRIFPLLAKRCPRSAKCGCFKVNTQWILVKTARGAQNEVILMHSLWIPSEEMLAERKT